jgi:hypothetical protein
MTEDSKESRKTGRPPVKLDLAQIEELAAIHCTREEIAGVIGVTARSLRRFQERADVAGAIERGQLRGKASLRRQQWKAAQAGNSTMLIWLGKQILGQKDRFEHSGPEPDGGIKIVFAGEDSQMYRGG